MDKNDTALVNQCDYLNKNNVKTILKNYNQFLELKQKGNATAICILADINNSIETLNSKQKHCITQYFKNEYLLEEIAEELDIRKQTVQEHIKKAIRNIMINLEGREAIEAVELIEKLMERCKNE